MRWENLTEQARAAGALCLMTKKDLRYFRPSLAALSVWLSMIRLWFQMGGDSIQLLEQGELVGCCLDDLAHLVQSQVEDDEGGLAAGVLLMVSEVNRKRVSAGRLVAMLRRQL